MSEYLSPQLAKVYEAISAAVDGRVRIMEAGVAEVRSSDGSKTYNVRWEGASFSSSDPLSRFHGRVGYPIIAVLLETGRLAWDRELGGALAGVPWKQVNAKFRNDYPKAAEHVLTPLARRSEIEAMASSILAELEALHLQRPGKV